MRTVDVFISHANVDKPLIKPIVEALLRDGFAVFVDRPEDEGIGFTADAIEDWRDVRKRLRHLRPHEVNNYNQALLDQVKGAGAVLGCLCTPLRPGQDHFGDELFLAATQNKLLLCRLGRSSPDEILANKGGLVRYNEAQICDGREIAPLALLLEGRGFGDAVEWPAPADDAQRRALDQYKFLRKELEDKLRGWKLGSLTVRTPEAAAAYARLLQSKIDRLTASARRALADALREQEIEPLAEALEGQRQPGFVDMAMNVDPLPILDAFARALHILDEWHAPETDAQAVRAAAQVVAPMISNQSDTERLQRALEGAEVEVIEARVGSGTMAEVLMAAAQRKATEFKERRKRGDKVLGSRAITLGAETGPEDGEARDVAAIILDLVAMKGVEIDVSRVQHRLKQVLEQDYGRSLSSYQHVQNRMVHEKKMKQRRYYLLADKPSTPAALDYVKAVLRQVCAVTPGLVAIITDPSLIDEEDARVLSLLETVKLEGGKG